VGLISQLMEIDSKYIFTKNILIYSTVEKGSNDEIKYLNTE